MRLCSLEMAATLIAESPAELIGAAGRIDAWLTDHGDPKEDPLLGASSARQALGIARRRACLHTDDVEALLAYADAILTALTPPAEHRKSDDADR